MKTMAYKIVGTVHLVLAGESVPTEAEWNEYTSAVNAELAKGVDIAAIRTLVFSDGGGPSAAQRKRVNDDLKGRTTRVAFVSSSMIMRGIVTALQWFNPEAQIFAPEQVIQALQFLQIPEHQHDLIWKEVQKLRIALGNAHLKSVKPGSKLPSDAR